MEEERFLSDMETPILQNPRHKNVASPRASAFPARFEKEQGSTCALVYNFSMKKTISTEPTPENIQHILHILAEVPAHLDRLRQGMDEQTLREPLAPDERSFHQILAHLIHCEARTFETITLALLTHEPVLFPIHPERDFGKLFPFEHQPFSDLLAYFKLRRAVLLPVLSGLNEKKRARVVQQAGKQRKESVYWQARVLALHEWEHVEEITKKLGSAPSVLNR